MNAHLLQRSLMDRDNDDVPDHRARPRAREPGEVAARATEDIAACLGATQPPTPPPSPLSPSRRRHAASTSQPTTAQPTTTSRSVTFPAASPLGKMRGLVETLSPPPILAAYLSRPPAPRHPTPPPHLIPFLRKRFADFRPPPPSASSAPSAPPAPGPSRGPSPGPAPAPTLDAIDESASEAKEDAGQDTTDEVDDGVAEMEGAEEDEAVEVDETEGEMATQSLLAEEREDATPNPIQ